MRLPFWGSILTLCGVIILVALGAWQVWRLEWKRSVLDAVEAEYAVDARSVPLSQGSLGADDLFRRGYVEGIFLHDLEVHIQPRVHEGTVGYHVVTPLRLLGEHDDVLLINRGWVPVDAEFPKGAQVDRKEGRVKVLGMLRHAPVDSSFVPENTPEDDLWFRLVPAEIGAARNIMGLWPVVLYAEEERLTGGIDAARDYPVSTATRVSPNNNHAQYAFFWFAMAAAMVVVYAFRFIVPQCASRQK